MNWILFFAVLFILLSGVFSIATTSIAIECYNKNEEHKTENPSNFGFLTINLIAAIILVLISIILLYYIMFKNLGSSAPNISFNYNIKTQPQLQAQTQAQTQAQAPPPPYSQNGGKLKGGKLKGGKWSKKY
jgi:flagellar basal body-associated protein FliL